MRVRAVGAFALGAATALPLLLATPVHEAGAQRRRTPVPQHRRETPMVALEGSGVFSTVRGDALATAGDGTGFDVLALIGSGVFALGGGYQRATHSRAGADNDATVDGFFIEPRVALPLAAGNFTPYVFGRASRLTLTPAPAGNNGEPKGTALGGGVGTYFWLADNVQINTAVMWQDLRFDRNPVNQPPLPVLGSDTHANGSQWSLRAGLSVGFDRWGR